MSETTAERKLLYRAIRELEYVQELGTGLAVSTEGAAIVREGMELLGVKDLSADELPGVYPEEGK